MTNKQMMKNTATLVVVALIVAFYVVFGYEIPQWIFGNRADATNVLKLITFAATGIISIVYFDTLRHEVYCILRDLSKKKKKSRREI